MRTGPGLAVLRTPPHPKSYVPSLTGSIYLELAVLVSAALNAVNAAAKRGGLDGFFLFFTCDPKVLSSRPFSHDRMPFYLRKSLIFFSLFPPPNLHIHFESEAWVHIASDICFLKQ